MPPFALSTKQGRNKLDVCMKRLQEIRAKEEAWGDTFETIIKARTPKKSGLTAESWKLYRGKDPNGGIWWKIVPEGKEDIVRYLEYGTKPHVILPVTKKALKFEVGGEEVFAAKVFHPGTKPLGFVRKTRREIEHQAKGLARMVKSAMKRLQG